jgi:2OG-Fe(II) oxygenase superfamily
MNQVLSKPEVLVIDNFLDSAALAFVWSYVQSEDFEHVHRTGWVTAWRLSDGSPLRGPVTLSHPSETDRLSAVYPTGGAMDFLIEKILEFQGDLVPWVGQQGRDWSQFFCRPYVYPAGAGLSWHRDNQNNATGAFTFYCHPTWNVQWGGELLVADIGTRLVKFPVSELYGHESKFLGTHMDNAPENDALLETAIGTYVLPKPNRLVVVPAGVLHAIKKVDPAAGDHHRVSLQGTFMFPEAP